MPWCVGSVSIPSEFLPVTCPHWKPNHIPTLWPPPLDSPQSNKHTTFITLPDSADRPLSLHTHTHAHAGLHAGVLISKLPRRPSFGHVTGSQWHGSSGNTSLLPEPLPKTQFATWQTCAFVCLDGRCNQRMVRPYSNVKWGKVRTIVSMWVCESAHRNVCRSASAANAEWDGNAIEKRSLNTQHQVNTARHLAGLHSAHNDLRTPQMAKHI